MADQTLIDKTERTSAASTDFLYKTNADGTTEGKITVANLKQSLGLGSAADVDTGTLAGNVPLLDANGKLLETVIPDIAISVYLGNFVDVATALADAGVQASERGDWFTVDTDGGRTYIVITDNPTVLADVTELKVPTSTVVSVNSKTGTVVINPDDLDDTATTNKFTTASDISKLAGIEIGAEVNPTASEIKTLYESNSDTNAFTDTDQSKLGGIESGADVTDETNVVSSLNGATLTNAGTPASDDKVLIQDTSDSNNLKYVFISNLPTGGGGGGNFATVGTGGDYATLGAAITGGETSVLIISNLTEAADITLPDGFNCRFFDPEFEINMGTFDVIGTGGHTYDINGGRWLFTTGFMIGDVACTLYLDKIFIQSTGSTNSIFWRNLTIRAGRVHFRGTASGGAIAIYPNNTSNGHEFDTLIVELGGSSAFTVANLDTQYNKLTVGNLVIRGTGSTSLTNLIGGQIANVNNQSSTSNLQFGFQQAGSDSPATNIGTFSSRRSVKFRNPGGGAGGGQLGQIMLPNFASLTLSGGRLRILGGFINDNVILEDAADNCMVSNLEVLGDFTINANSNNNRITNVRVAGTYTNNGTGTEDTYR